MEASARPITSPWRRGGIATADLEHLPAGNLPAGLNLESNDRRDFRNADPASRHIEFYCPSCRRSRTSRHASALDHHQPIQRAKYHDHHAPGRNIGQAYSQPVAATGGIGALTWSISAGTLPQGLNINPINGVISGTPTNAETANFTVRVADTLSQSDTQDLSIIVSDALSITTTSATQMRKRARPTRQPCKAQEASHP